MPKKKAAAVIEEGPHFDEKDVPIEPQPTPPPKLRGFCRWNFGQKNACPNRSVVRSEWCADHKCSDCDANAAITLGRCVKCFGKWHRAS